MSKLPRFVLRLAWFYLGLVIMSVGISCTINASLGTSPWDVLHVAISLHLPMTVGQAMIGVGLVVVGIGWLLGVRPALGTVLNMATVGLLVDLIRPHVPHGAGWLAWVQLLVGVALNGLGTGLYVGGALGAGPRDGLLVGITRRVDRPVGAIRVAVEVVVVLVGWLLGGPLGLGTVALALVNGPATQLGFALMDRLAAWPGLRTFVEPMTLRPGTTPVGAPGAAAGR